MARGVGQINHVFIVQHSGDLKMQMIMGKGGELFRTITTRREEMSANWRDQEIRKLLLVRADAKIDRFMGLQHSMVYDQITKQLRAHCMFRRGAD